MIKFIKEPEKDNPYDSVRVRMETTSEASMADMVNMFRRFLMACSYPPELVNDFIEEVEPNA